MSALERVYEYVDLELSKKIFLVLSVVALLAIPLDGVLVYLGHTAHGLASKHTQEKPLKKIETEEVYLANFDRNPLFGDVAGMGSSALRASAAELIKDYRLQGVILTDEPEAIIQDARTQKTVFAKKGDRLGDLAVKEVKEGVVVLSYLNEEIKLEIQ